MSLRTTALQLVPLIVALAASTFSSAQDHDHASMEHLGSVSFNTSCNGAAQPQINRAVALLHSFQFGGAIAGFRSTLAADPSCSIAYWGIALSSWGNPFAAGLKPQAQLQQGLKAVEQARATPPKTQRERDYVEAVARLYTDTASTSQRQRVLAYETAMQTLSSTYSDDVEASIFYALALAEASDPADKTYAKQLKAGAMLEALFVRYPDHPGLAHYIIHTYDVPPLAARAVGAAQRYSQIAPSSPHALHMPSHTFTRVGDWQSSIDTNIASAAAARSGHEPAEELHASDYLVYAYLQTAQDKAAHEVAESAVDVFSHYDSTLLINGAASPAAAYFARAAIPARYALERGAWADAAQLEPHPSPVPFADAMTYFARGLGAAHVKDFSSARSSIASLEQMHDKLKTSKEDYWAYEVEIQRLEVAAWLAFVEDGPNAGLAAMRAAAEMEDKTEKNAITPGPLAPARELLGEMLLEARQPAEAFTQFEATLKKEPNRFRSLYGAAEAAKLLGDHEKAQTYFLKLLQITAKADSPGRPELVEARVETQHK